MTRTKTDQAVLRDLGGGNVSDPEQAPERDHAALADLQAVGRNYGLTEAQANVWALGVYMWLMTYQIAGDRAEATVQPYADR